MLAAAPAQWPGPPSGVFSDVLSPNLAGYGGQKCPPACDGGARALGDSFLHASSYRSSRALRRVSFAAGAMVLVACGSMVNAPGWDFGKLLGVYVAMLFVTAQLVNGILFGISPAAPLRVGGGLFLAGAAAAAFWRT